jgi:hypothetical protein
MAAMGAIERETGSNNHSLEVGESDPFGVPPETFQVVSQTCHKPNVTEYSYARKRFFALSLVARSGDQ